MRPSARILLDSGDPEETRRVKETLGFLDGQTTNPSLVAKNPRARGRKFTSDELLALYREVAREVSAIVSDGTVSLEVYADKSTTAEEMLSQGREFFSWIENAHIKFPTTAEGLKAAEAAVAEGLRVNMTLCFAQAQAAAVYAATRGAKKGDVFVSPFIGRLDDRGENGMDLIANILRMYEKGDGHVEVLTASVRNPEHIAEALFLATDLLTAPAEQLEAWAERGMRTAEERRVSSLEPIAYEDLDLTAPWESFDIAHELTEKGQRRFADDWNALL